VETIDNKESRKSINQIMAEHAEVQAALTREF